MRKRTSAPRTNAPYVIFQVIFQFNNVIDTFFQIFSLGYFINPDIWPDYSHHNIKIKIYIHIYIFIHVLHKNKWKHLKTQTKINLLTVRYYTLIACNDKKAFHICISDFIQ